MLKQTRSGSFNQKHLRGVVLSFNQNFNVCVLISARSVSIITSSFSLTRLGNMVEPSDQLLLLNSRYRLEKRLVCNHSNTIWRAADIKTRQFVAVKQISPVTYNAFVEGKVLKAMKKTIGFPDFYGTTNSEDSCFLIMQLLHRDLESVFRSHSRSFTGDLVVRLGLCMIERVRRLHNNGFIHRDIKPAQFMLDSHSDTLYLIDFNLSSKIPSMMSTTTSDMLNSYVGNATFASISAHSTRHQSMKDDLESVIYVLIYFLIGVLPWQKLSYDNDSEMWAKIKLCKASTPLDELCRGLPYEISQCLNYCRSLRSYDIPDYDYLSNLLGSARFNTQSFTNIVKSNTEGNIKIPKDFLLGIRTILSETIGVLSSAPIVGGKQKAKKKRYPRILDRSMLRKVDEFMKESNQTS